MPINRYYKYWYYKYILIVPRNLLNYTNLTHSWANDGTVMQRIRKELWLQAQVRVLFLTSSSLAAADYVFQKALSMLMNAALLHCFSTFVFIHGVSAARGGTSSKGRLHNVYSGCLFIFQHAIGISFIEWVNERVNV